MGLLYVKQKEELKSFLHDIPRVWEKIQNFLELYIYYRKKEINLYFPGHEQIFIERYQNRSGT
jgi:hypothetical protein